jgi:hypothetical protein
VVPELLVLEATTRDRAGRSHLGAIVARDGHGSAARPLALLSDAARVQSAHSVLDALVVIVVGRVRMDVTVDDAIVRMLVLVLAGRRVMVVFLLWGRHSVLLSEIVEQVHKLALESVERFAVANRGEHGLVPYLGHASGLKVGQDGLSPR